MSHELTEEVLDAARVICEFVGVDLTNSDLHKTPERFVRALAELTEGRNTDVEALLETQFADDSDELIIVDGISFSSVCEHHLLPFRGTAKVGYVPRDGRVVGLSKIPRVVQALSRRPQIQERLTRQIALAVLENLNCIGVGVVLEAEHMCMTLRGVRQPSASLRTSSMLGVFRDDPTIRSEFLAL